MNVCHSTAKPGEDGIADEVDGDMAAEWLMGLLVILTTHSPAITGEVHWLRLRV